MHIQALVLTVSTAAVVNASLVPQMENLSDTDLIEHTSALLDNYVEAHSSTMNDTAFQFIGMSTQRSRMQIMWYREVVSKYNFHESSSLPTEIRDQIHDFQTYLDTGGAATRTIFGDALSKIWGYGCWCNFDEDVTLGRAQPVDVYDRICRNYQLCMRCARRDGKVSGNTCDPVGQNYVAQNSISSSTGIGCTVSGEECEEHVCNCDQNLLAELLDLLFSGTGEVPDDSYKHDNGYDFEGNCVASAVTFDDVVCCGEYPTRYPYSPSNSNKDCCRDTTVFNPIQEECCTDGTAGAIGACP